MSPRRNARREQPPRAGGQSSVAETIEDHAGLPHVVRRIAGAAAGKAYRCPGCLQEVRQGTAHVVAWPEGTPENRRHWHSPCWAARARRGAAVERSRNAPRHG